MTDALIHPVECQTCGYALGRSGDELPLACPSCGGTQRLHRVTVTETITLHERVDLKARHPDKKKWFRRVQAGDDLHRNSKTWSDLHREIDRENNVYREKIIAADGTVARDIAEPLSEHVASAEKTRRSAAETAES